jgi:hypothetical protein
MLTPQSRSNRPYPAKPPEHAKQDVDCFAHQPVGGIDEIAPRQRTSRQETGR